LLNVVNSGMVYVGQRGELPSRLLWLLAKVFLFIRTEVKNVVTCWSPRCRRHGKSISSTLKGSPSWIGLNFSSDLVVFGTLQCLCVLLVRRTTHKHCLHTKRSRMDIWISPTGYTWRPTSLDQRKGMNYGRSSGFVFLAIPSNPMMRCTIARVDTTMTSLAEGSAATTDNFSSTRWYPSISKAVKGLNMHVARLHFRQCSRINEFQRCVTQDRSNTRTSEWP